MDDHSGRIPAPAAGTIRDEAARVCSAAGRLPGAARRSFIAGRFIGSLDQFHDVHAAVQSGSVAIFLESKAGREHLTEVLAPGACIGRHAASSGVGERCKLVALEPAVVLEVPMDSYLELLSRDSGLAAAAAGIKAWQHAMLLRRLTVLHLQTPPERVAAALLYLTTLLATRCPLARGSHVRLSQSTIAATAGLGRQSANRALRQLAHSRLIHVERGFLCVLRPEALGRVVSGGVPAQPEGGPTTCKLRTPLVRLTCPTSSEDG